VAVGPLPRDAGHVGMDVVDGSDHRFESTSDGLFAASIALAGAAHDTGPALALIEDWSAREPGGNPAGIRRYPWPISSRFTLLSPCAPPQATWRAWRPSEEVVRSGNPVAFESRLLLPPILADSCELLELLAAGHDAARSVRDRVVPVMRRDLAHDALGDHAWGDTWALWNLARRPRALGRLHPFALALADTYAARAVADGGVGRGSRFPFHNRPMVSVSAQLATGLLALGVHPGLAGQLAAWVGDQEASDGSFADAQEPPDPLTTLVAADLLLGLDPGWDPAPTVRWLDDRRRSDGTVVAYGPEVAWLTLAVDELAERARRPFAARFRWPQLSVVHLDRRTMLPFLSYLEDLAGLFAAVPSLKRHQVELAFLDLAGFGAWNNLFGMARGDEVLQFLASELQGIPDALAIRDGGDEFVVLGAPGRTGLASTMDAFRVSFPRRFAARFGSGAPPVALRVVTTTVDGACLVAGRDCLGVAISALKHAHPTPPPEGVSAVVDCDVAGSGECEV
jgi:GGDEF domain-containing protein